MGNMTGTLPPATRHHAAKPASQYHHGDLERALLEVAVRIIGEEGVEGLTLREVGTCLGVSRSALYRHFANKSALLAAVARDGYQRLKADLVDAVEGGDGARRGFELMGVAYVRFAVAHPAHYRVMFGGYKSLCAVETDLQADADAAFQVLVDALSSLQRAGRVRPDDPRRLAQFSWSIVHGIAMLAVDGQLGPNPAASGELTALIHFALKRIRTGIDIEAGPLT